MSNENFDESPPSLLEGKGGAAPDYSYKRYVFGQGSARGHWCVLERDSRSRSDQSDRVHRLLLGMLPAKGEAQITVEATLDDLPALQGVVRGYLPQWRSQNQQDGGIAVYYNGPNLSTSESDDGWKASNNRWVITGRDAAGRSGSVGFGPIDAWHLSSCIGVVLRRSFEFPEQAITDFNGFVKLVASK